MNEPQPETSVPKQKVKVEKSKNGTENSKNKGTPPGQTSMRRFLAGCSATSWNVTSTSNIPRNKRKYPDFTITEQGELVEARLRSKMHKQQKPKPAPKRNKFDKAILKTRISDGSRLMSRRNAFKKYGCKPRRSSMYSRISDMTIENINKGIKVAMICTRRRTPKSTRKKCNGSVMMVKSRGKLNFQCTKCLGCMQPTELEDSHQADETEPYVNHSTEELKICYVTLLRDMGFPKYKRLLISPGLVHVSESTYYRQAKNLYVLQEESFEDFQKHAIKEVERLYALQGLTRDENV